MLNKALPGRNLRKTEAGLYALSTAAAAIWLLYRVFFDFFGYAQVYTGAQLPPPGWSSSQGFVVGALLLAVVLTVCAVRLRVRTAPNPNRDLASTWANLSRVSQKAFWTTTWAGMGLFALVAFWQPGMWFSGWLWSSVSDANLARGAVEAGAFRIVVQLLLFLVLCWGLWPRLFSLAAFMSSWCRHVAAAADATLPAQQFIAALRDRPMRAHLRPAHPIVRNSIHSSLWFAACYSVLYFSVVWGPGPIGQAMHKTWRFWPIEPGDLAIQYMASIAALFGFVPLAFLTSCWLPLRTLPALQTFEHGVCFPHTELLRLQFRPVRLWHEFQSISLDSGSPEDEQVLSISFQSGATFKARVRQFREEELLKLLESIDKRSPQCQIDQRTVELYRKLMRVHPGIATTHGARYAPCKMIDSDLRIVDFICESPSSRVYAARNRSGKLLMVQEFKAAGGCLQTIKQACAKLATCTDRRVSPVVGCFEKAGSVFVVRQHPGTVPLSAYLKEHGCLDSSRARELALELAKLACTMHAAGLPPGRWSPSELYVLPDGNLVLTTFNNPGTLPQQPSVRMGSARNVALEQNLQLESETEIYGFGCLLHFLLTGSYPFLPGGAPQPSKSEEDLTMRVAKACTSSNLGRRPSSFLEIIRQLEGDLPQAGEQCQLSLSGCDVSDEGLIISLNAGQTVDQSA